MMRSQKYRDRKAIALANMGEDRQSEPNTDDEMMKNIQIRPQKLEQIRRQARGAGALRSNERPDYRD